MIEEMGWSMRKMISFWSHFVNAQDGLRENGKYRNTRVLTQKETRLFRVRLSRAILQ